MENTLGLLYGHDSEIDAVCRDKLLEYIQGIDEKQMKSVKEFYLDAVKNFKMKFPSEYETSNLKTLTSIP